MSQCSHQEFFILGWIATCRQRRSKSSFMTGKTAFGLASVAVLSEGKAIMHHTSISPLRRSRCVAWIDGNHSAADPQFASAQSMIMLRVIAFVGQDATRSKVGGRLTHGGSKVRRILAGALPSNRTHHQLASCVKNRGEFWPSGMRRCATAASSLKMYRGMAGFKPRRIDCRRIARIIGDQPIGSSPVAANSEKSFKPPFSRSFRSTCHNVE